jgi:hypothetical protein
MSSSYNPGVRTGRWVGGRRRSRGESKCKLGECTCFGLGLLFSDPGYFETHQHESTGNVIELDLYKTLHLQSQLCRSLFTDIT